MEKKTAVVLLVLLCILSLGNALYWASQKEGFHCDEVYSYGLSNTQFHYETHTAEGVRWNTPADIKAYMTAKDGFQYGTVLENQRTDVHPPFFYLILHTLSSLFPGSYAKYLAIVPNLLFSVGTCIFLYLIGMQLCRDRAWALLGVMLYGFCVHYINMATFVRMYALLTFLTVAVLFVHLRLLERQGEMSWPLAVALVTTVFLAAMTHYYFFVFLAFCAVFYCMFLRRSQNRLAAYFGLLVLSALLFCLAWPAVFGQLFQSFRGDEAFYNAAHSSLFRNIKIFSYVLYRGLGAVPFLLAFVAALRLIRRRQKVNPELSFLFGASLLYFLVICKVAPYQADRYIAPIVPMVCVLLVYVIWAAFQERKAVIAILLALGLFINGGIRLFSPAADAKGENYLYRMPPDYKAFLQRERGQTCVMVYTHEAQFLLQLPDFMYFSETAFIMPHETEQLFVHLSGKPSFLLYINEQLPGEEIAASLTESLGFDGFREEFAPLDRAEARIYRIFKK